MSKLSGVRVERARIRSFWKPTGIRDAYRGKPRLWTRLWSQTIVVLRRVWFEINWTHYACVELKINRCASRRFVFGECRRDFFCVSGQELATR